MGMGKRAMPFALPMNAQVVIMTRLGTLAFSTMKTFLTMSHFVNDGNTQLLDEWG